MRLGTIEYGSGTSAVVVRDRGVVPVRSLAGRESARNVSDLIDNPLTSDELVALDGVTTLDKRDCRWLPPLFPSKNVFCVGKNYLAHVLEGAKAEGLSTASAPRKPVWFTKARTALIGHNRPIRLHPAAPLETDYEGELAVVIGRIFTSQDGASPADAVFGYTIFNDITARDIQQERGQWFLGKSFDTFGPVGPWIVTKDEVLDPQNVRITSSVNNEIRQDGNTSEMIFSVEELIADLSQHITLEPGDIIATGTPAGVAWGKGGSKYLHHADTVRITIEGIGELSNPVEVGK